MVSTILRGCGRALLLFYLLGCAVRAEASPGCVWKVTAPDGGTLYLGGSIHALRSVDYPLPSAYNRAFDASSRLALEVDAKALQDADRSLIKTGQYPKGDNLKNHVDPRTYDYVHRLFGLMHVPEAEFSKYRPWMLVLLLESAGRREASGNLGVESFLLQRAKANSKPVIGLETAQESAQVFAGLTDRQSEALLLITFIPQAEGKDSNTRLMEAWRAGDVDQLARMVHQGYSEFPSFGERLLDARNRNWIPKIERELHSGRVCFVVVGAGHLGGPAGLLNLLRARGYRLERM